MISFLAYTKSKNELTLLKQTVTDISSVLSDEDLKMYGFLSRDKFEKFLENCPVLDISCVDICGNGGIDYAKKVRSTNKDMSILLIVDLSLSPATYIIPSIMAASLLIRPFDRAAVKNVLDTVLKDYCEYFEQEDGGKSFVVETREGKQLVPYSGIVYFESRNKKIFLGTDNGEYSHLVKGDKDFSKYTRKAKHPQADEGMLMFAPKAVESVSDIIGDDGSVTVTYVYDVSKLGKDAEEIGTKGFSTTYFFDKDGELEYFTENTVTKDAQYNYRVDITERNSVDKIENNVEQYKDK